MKERIRTGLRIPYEMNTELILEAQQMGISKNALILQILREHQKKKEPEGGGKEG